jgi:hypothetical protein
MKSCAVGDNAGGHRTHHGVRSGGRQPAVVGQRDHLRDGQHHQSVRSPMSLRSRTNTKQAQ